jgi:hypothetical protein
MLICDPLFVGQGPHRGFANRQFDEELPFPRRWHVAAGFLLRPCRVDHCHEMSRASRARSRRRWERVAGVVCELAAFAQVAGEVEDVAAFASPLQGSHIRLVLECVPSHADVFSPSGRNQALQRAHCRTTAIGHGSIHSCLLGQLRVPDFCRIPRNPSP